MSLSFLYDCLELSYCPRASLYSSFILFRPKILGFCSQEGNFQGIQKLTVWIYSLVRTFHRLHFQFGQSGGTNLILWRPFRVWIDSKTAEY